MADGRPRTTLENDELNLAVALGIGLLLGVERERHKGRGPGRAPAGVRTFALVALIGGLSWRLGGEVTAAVALGVVGLAAIAGYLQGDREDPGMTTEVALVATFLLGALAQTDPQLAAGIGVATAIVLASRDQLHVLVRDTLSERELHDGLLLAACALIVLPLIPDEGVGPNEALNPQTVWRLVVIVMGLQAAGHVALRAIGPRLGLPIVGLIGGFVSSTATIATMGARAVHEPELRMGATAAGIASSVATVVLLAVVIGAVSTEALADLAVALVLAGLAALAYAAPFALRATRVAAPERAEEGRAFDLRVAVLLATGVTAVLVVSGALNEAAGGSGVVLATAIAGFADSQSAAISAATLAAGGAVSLHDAELAILAALTTNTISKAVMAGWLGSRGYALAIVPGLVLILLAAWGGWLLTA